MSSDASAGSGAKKAGKHSLHVNRALLSVDQARMDVNGSLLNVH